MHYTIILKQHKATGQTCRAIAFGPIKCNAPADSRLLLFPDSFSGSHVMFVTLQGALHFICCSNAFALGKLERGPMLTDLADFE
jgi:hypothetical protein